MADLDHFRVRFYERQAASLVTRLRSMADDVERAAVPSPTSSITGTPRYLNAAEQVNHALTWGLANASAYRLFEAAYHADAEEAEAVS